MPLPDVPLHPRPGVLPPEHLLSCWRMSQTGDELVATVGFTLRADAFDYAWAFVTPGGGRVLGTASAPLGAQTVVVSLTCDPAVANHWEQQLRSGHTPEIVHGVDALRPGADQPRYDIPKKKRKRR